MFNSTIFKTYGKGTINSSINKAYIIHFFNYSLSKFEKIIPSLCQIQWSAKRMFIWFPFAIFKSPWSIPLRLTYTMQPIRLSFLVRQTNFTKTFRDFWNDIVLTFIFVMFQTCIRMQYLLQYCSLSSHVLGVVACTCNPATLVAEFRNSVGSIPVGGNRPSISGWIVWPAVIQH